MPTVAATVTFDSLLVDLQDYLERGDVLDTTVVRQMPRIINNTERSLANKLKIQGYIGPYTSLMQVGEPRVAKPVNWRSTVSINYGRGTTQQSRFTLRARSYEYMRARYPDTTVLNAPEFYSDYDIDHWLVLPTPNFAYPFEAMIYRLPDLLDSTNQQNYLTKLAPFLLTYECLSALEPFLRNDARIAVWKSLAKEQFDAIDQEDLRRMVDRGQVRSTD